MSNALAVLAALGAAAAGTGAYPAVTAPVHAGSTQPGAAARPDASSSSVFLTASETPEHKAASYRVRPGDTLSGISQEFCGTPADYPHLAAASGISDPNYIYPGELVRLACHAALSTFTGQPVPPSSPPVTVTSVTGTVPQDIAREMLAQLGEPGQYGCLYELWERESGWDVYADNPSSGAYGIPQALPGSKMASAGADWESDAATQIRWGLEYIGSVYGTPCGAWAHEEAAGWY